jgi:hypothetical protein
MTPFQVGLWRGTGVVLLVCALVTMAFVIVGADHFLVRAATVIILAGFAADIALTLYRNRTSQLPGEGQETDK